MDDAAAELKVRHIDADVLFVSGPPGCGQFQWLMHQVGSAVPVLSPEDFYARHPNAGLHKLAHSATEALQEHKRCAIREQRGQWRMLANLCRAIHRRQERLDAAVSLRTLAVQLKPRGGAAQCQAALLVRRMSAARADTCLDALRESCNTAAQNEPDHDSFDRIERITLPESAPENEKADEGGRQSEFAKVVFVSREDLLRNTNAAQRVIGERECVVLLSSDEADGLEGQPLPDTHRAELAGRFFCAGTRRLSAALKDGLSPQQSAMVVACAALRRQPSECAFLERDRLQSLPGLAHLPLPSPSSESTESIAADALPYSAFRKVYPFGVVFGRFAGAAAGNDRLQADASGRSSALADASSTGDTEAPMRAEWLTDELILTHLRGRRNVLANSASVQLNSLHSDERSASAVAVGSAGENYSVSFTVNGGGSAGSIAASSCTCAYFVKSTDGRGCKHVAALMCAVRDASHAEPRTAREPDGEAALPHKERRAAKEQTKEAPPKAAPPPTLRPSRDAPRELPAWANGGDGAAPAHSQRKARATKTRESFKEGEPSACERGDDDDDEGSETAMAGTRPKRRRVLRRGRLQTKPASRVEASGESLGSSDDEEKGGRMETEVAEKPVARGRRRSARLSARTSDGEERTPPSRKRHLRSKLEEESDENGGNGGDSRDGAAARGSHLANGRGKTVESRETAEEPASRHDDLLDASQTAESPKRRPRSVSAGSRLAASLFFDDDDDEEEGCTEQVVAAGRGKSDRTAADHDDPQSSTISLADNSTPHPPSPRSAAAPPRGHSTAKKPKKSYQALARKLLG